MTCICSMILVFCISSETMSLHRASRWQELRRLQEVHSCELIPDKASSDSMTIAFLWEHKVLLIKYFTCKEPEKIILKKGKTQFFAYFLRSTLICTQYKYNGNISSEAVTVYAFMQHNRSTGKRMCRKRQHILCFSAAVPGNSLNIFNFPLSTETTLALERLSMVLVYCPFCHFGGFLLPLRLFPIPNKQPERVNYSSTYQNKFAKQKLLFQFIFLIQWLSSRLLRNFFT